MYQPLLICLDLDGLGFLSKGYSEAIEGPSRSTYRVEGGGEGGGRQRREGSGQEENAGGVEGGGVTLLMGGVAGLWIDGI